MASFDLLICIYKYSLKTHKKALSLNLALSINIESPNQDMSRQQAEWRQCFARKESQMFGTLQCIFFAGTHHTDTVKIHTEKKSF